MSLQSAFCDDGIWLTYKQLSEIKAGGLFYRSLEVIKGCVEHSQ